MSRASEPRRVVYSHDGFGFGGMELYVLRLIDHLDRNRYEPSLLVPGFRDQYRSSEDRMLEEAEHRGIDILRPSDPGSSRFSSATELIATARLLRSHRADVVHIHTFQPMGARKVTLASRAARIPGLIRTEHFPPSVTANASDWYKVRPFDWLTDYIVTVSEGDRHEQMSLLRRPPAKVVRVYNSVEVNELEPNHDSAAAKVRLGLDPTVPVLTNIGRLAPQKAQDVLIDATARVVSSSGPVNLVIVGDGELRDDLELQAERLGIRRYVHFAGFQEDVSTYIQATDIAVMPSLFEGFSLAMLEFMACAKPIVASDHSSFTEAITEGCEGMLVPRGDSDGFANALVMLLDDAALRTRMGAAGRGRVEANYSMERLSAEMMDLYDRAGRHGRDRE